MATGKYKIIYVAPILFLLDSISITFFPEGPELLMQNFLIVS